MQTPSSSSAALPIARAVLRVVIVLNWVGGAGILALLLVVPHEQWILRSFDLSPSPAADRLILGLRTIAVIGLVAVVLYHVILSRLLAMVETVRDGDPFVTANADRLRTIAWSLLALQFLGLGIHAIARTVAIPGRPLHITAEFSIGGCLVVLLMFLLARVFAEGAHMREDLEGTV